MSRKQESFPGLVEQVPKIKKEAAIPATLQNAEPIECIVLAIINHYGKNYDPNQREIQVPFDFTDHEKTGTYIVNPVPLVQYWQNWEFFESEGFYLSDWAPRLFARGFLDRERIQDGRSWSYRYHLTNKGEKAIAGVDDSYLLIDRYVLQQKKAR